MSFAMKEDLATGPADVGLLGADRVSSIRSLARTRSRSFGGRDEGDGVSMAEGLDIKLDVSEAGGLSSLMDYLSARIFLRCHMESPPRYAESGFR
jgi:hypothetical protein